MKKGDIAGLIFLVGMLCGLAALFAFAPRQPEVAFAPEEVSGSALVLIEASEPGVVVDAVMGKPGFITLHELVGTAPGPLVGTSPVLGEGIHSALMIPVSQGLNVVSDYVMLMVADDGDGVYEPGIDRPVMVNGQVIRVPVTFSTEATSLSK